MFSELPCNLKMYVPKTFQKHSFFSGQEMYGFFLRTNWQQKKYVPITFKKPNALAVLYYVGENILGSYLFKVSIVQLRKGQKVMITLSDKGRGGEGYIHTKACGRPFILVDSAF